MLVLVCNLTCTQKLHFSKYSISSQVQISMDIAGHICILNRKLSGNRVNSAKWRKTFESLLSILIVQAFFIASLLTTTKSLKTTSHPIAWWVLNVVFQLIQSISIKEYSLSSSKAMVHNHSLQIIILLFLRKSRTTR